jgi:hypothetical protein
MGEVLNMMNKGELNRKIGGSQGRSGTRAHLKLKYCDSFASYFKTVVTKKLLGINSRTDHKKVGYISV